MMNENPQNCNSPAMLARLAAVEKKLEQAHDTHKEFYDRIRALEMSRAILDERYATIIAKLDELTTSMVEITSKPARRWDAAVEKVIYTIIGAIVAFIFAKIGM